MEKPPLLRIYNSLKKEFGCQNWWPAKGAEEVMIGAVLTQNIAWKNAKQAISSLRKENKLSFKKIDKTGGKELAELIRSARFLNQKSKVLKSFAGYLGERYGFSIKRMKKTDVLVLRKELLSLYRIGPETADSILLYALEKPVFVVDAYTKRIFSRHGYLKIEASYDDCQKLFMDNIPEDVELYNDYHAQLVHLGNRFCRPKPDCGKCPLNRYGKTKFS